jgi:hypothetical protein
VVGQSRRGARKVGTQLMRDSETQPLYYHEHLHRNLCASPLTLFMAPGERIQNNPLSDRID